MTVVNGSLGDGLHQVEANVPSIPRGQPWDQSSSTPISGMDDEIQHTLSNSADDTKLCGAVGTTE